MSDSPHPLAKERFCVKCGSSFYGSQRSRKYCSAECSGSGPAKIASSRCRLCAVRFDHPAHEKRVYCSTDCHLKHLGMRQRGKRHPMWNHGATETNLRIRASAQYAEWRRKVLERDDHTCQACARRGGVLHAHHIVHYKDDPRLRLKVSNGIVLCSGCHKDLHANYAEIGIQETKLSKRVAKFLSAEPGCYFLNVHGGPMQEGGHPDFLGSIMGRCVGIELKIRPNVLAPIQRHRLKLWSDAGAIVRVCHSLDDVVSVVEMVKQLEGEHVQ